MSKLMQNIYKHIISGTHGILFLFIYSKFISARGKKAFVLPIFFVIENMKFL